MCTGSKHLRFVWQIGLLLPMLLFGLYFTPGVDTRIASAIAPTLQESLPHLQQGDSGPLVIALQFLLRANGATITADGDFGGRTHEAVVVEQTEHGLFESGVVDRDVWDLLLIPLWVGDEGDAVRAAQTLLNEYGAQLQLDGDYGSLTQSAVQEFQTMVGIPETGNIDIGTWISLLTGSAVPSLDLETVFAVEPLPDPQEIQALIDSYTTLGNLDESGLGAALLGRLPEETRFVTSTIYALDSTDWDDVSVEISRQATSAQLQSIGDHERGRTVLMMLVQELQGGITTADEVEQINRLVQVLLEPDHNKMRDEGWATQVAVLEALAVTNSTIQSINDGHGDNVYDEYSVVITTMPPDLTPEQYLSEMAHDLNGAVNNSSFDEINVFRRVTNLNSDPSIGDLYDIDIMGPDNGSVMLVEQSANSFIFQTVNSPNMGEHPENGSRQFGFELLLNGQVRFFTRGASRPHSLPYVTGRSIQNKGWTSMMYGIGNEMNSRGGTSDVWVSWWTSHPD